MSITLHLINRESRQSLVAAKGIIEMERKLDSLAMEFL